MNPFEIYNIPPEKRRFRPVYTAEELYEYTERLLADGLLSERTHNLKAARDILMDATALEMEEAAVTPAAEITPPFIYIRKPRFSPLVDENGMHYPLTGNATDDVNEWARRLLQNYNIDGFVVDGEIEDSFLNFCPRGIRQEFTAWKMHISASTPQAAEALAEMAHHYKLPHIKTSAYRYLDEFTKPEERQRGKAVTIYHSEKNAFNKVIDWQAIVSAAEAIVAAYGGPGPEVHWDRKVSDTIF